MCSKGWRSPGQHRRGHRTIKASPSPADAREALLSASAGRPARSPPCWSAPAPSATRPDDLEPEFGLHDGRYRLSPAQAQAILDLRLHRLTGLEHEKLLKEYQDKLSEIADLLDILAGPGAPAAGHPRGARGIAEEFGDERRTEKSATPRPT
jgi:DNA gyrase subunit A